MCHRRGAAPRGNRAGVQRRPLLADQRGEFLLPLFRALGIKPPEKSLPYFVTASAARISEWAGALRGKKPAFDRTGLAILTEDVRHDPAKALRDFGWSSQVDLTEGIEKTAAWFKERYGVQASV